MSNSEHLEKISKQLQSLQEDFQSKIKYDQHKEKIIDSLHNELQKHKEDLIKQIVKPFILDVIQLLDNMHKSMNKYKEDAEKNQLLIENLENTISDLQDILYRQGTEIFSSNPDNPFSAKKQKINKVIATDIPKKDKLVVNSILCGYEWEGKVIRPEWVNVYKFEKKEKES